MEKRDEAQRSELESETVTKAALEPTGSTSMAMAREAEFADGLDALGLGAAEAGTEHSAPASAVARDAHASEPLSEGALAQPGSTAPAPSPLMRFLHWLLGDA